MAWRCGTDPGASGRGAGGVWRRPQRVAEAEAGTGTCGGGGLHDGRSLAPRPRVSYSPSPEVGIFQARGGGSAAAGGGDDGETEQWPAGQLLDCCWDDDRRGRLEAVAIRTSEYTSNALMSGGGSCDVSCLRKVKAELTLRKNWPFWYMLSTWKGDGEKLANSSSPSL
uniref:Uncharacterized protein n=1 Tax=Oryza glumipatula TaxID=40148 RepID=A0A0D9Y9N2_9ORYZ